MTTFTHHRTESMRETRAFNVTLDLPYPPVYKSPLSATAVEITNDYDTETQITVRFKPGYQIHVLDAVAELLRLLNE